MGKKEEAFLFIKNNLDISCFSCCRFDICDINGLYTCFNHPEIIKIRKKYKYLTKLIPEENIELALELANMQIILTNLIAHL